MEKLKIMDKIELIYFEPGATFSPASISNYLDKILEYKFNTLKYQRFFNLSKIKSNLIKPDDIENIVHLAKDFRLNNRDIRTCFYCKNDEDKKLVDIFVEKMKPDFIYYFASTKLEECTDYLNINIEYLKKL